MAFDVLFSYTGYHIYIFTQNYNYVYTSPAGAFLDEFLIPFILEDWIHIYSSLKSSWLPTQFLGKSMYTVNAEQMCENTGGTTIISFWKNRRHILRFSILL